jgi:hypothetical protein
MSFQLLVDRISQLCDGECAFSNPRNAIRCQCQSVNQGVVQPCSTTALNVKRIGGEDLIGPCKQRSSNCLDCLSPNLTAGRGENLGSPLGPQKLVTHVSGVSAHLSSRIRASGQYEPITVDRLVWSARDQLDNLRSL